MAHRNPVRRLALAAPFLVGPAQADGSLSTDRDRDCGGDAFSSAQVIERRPIRRGPITAVPETLCADVAPQRPSNIEIQVYPLVTPENGGGQLGAPYERRHR